MSPAIGVQGASVPVTLTGTNFVSGATVAVSNPGVAVGSVTVVSDKRITATLTIGATAALGAANMTVTTSAGTSAAAVFTVNPLVSRRTGPDGALQAPDVSGRDPDRGARE